MVCTKNHLAPSGLHSDEWNTHTHAYEVAQEKRQYQKTMSVNLIRNVNCFLLKSKCQEKKKSLENKKDEQVLQSTTIKQKWKKTNETFTLTKRKKKIRFLTREMSMKFKG